MAKRRNPQARPFKLNKPQRWKAHRSIVGPVFHRFISEKGSRGRRNLFIAVGEFGHCPKARPWAALLHDGVHHAHPQRVGCYKTAGGAKAAGTRRAQSYASNPLGALHGPVRRAYRGYNIGAEAAEEGYGYDPNAPYGMGRY